ncbi:hypothetical protein M422DRAFT_267778 [Sphaerobolus stellatus SS14]|uniref:Uncharacterized protein n=1 Tax=Sphaerobolus stellatus (strain SS14) TaxID=990650 RepID=A0A0C9UP02_SPHS4|nr:hypothetical protein M422DRAFT_267778 [Sphaerobolus stellatus SS14]
MGPVMKYNAGWTAGLRGIEWELALEWSVKVVNMSTMEGSGWPHERKPTTSTFATARGLYRGCNNVRDHDGSSPSIKVRDHDGPPPSIRPDTDLVLQLIPNYADVVRHPVRRHGTCSSFPRRHHRHRCVTRSPRDPYILSDDATGPHLNSAAPGARILSNISTMRSISTYVTVVWEILGGGSDRWLDSNLKPVFRAETMPAIFLSPPILSTERNDRWWAAYIFFDEFSSFPKNSKWKPLH